MSDRSAGDLFRTMFRLIGSDPTPQHIKWAKKLWKKSGEFDTHPGDWGCDKDLITCGLAKRGANKDYPEDGTVILYKGMDY